MSPDSFHIFPTSKNTLHQALSFFEKEMKDVPCDEETYLDLKIAFTELINNAVNHGNKNDRGKKIRVSISFSGDEVVMRVKDEGDGFGLEELRDPTLHANLLLPTGRGLFLVKKLMDRLTLRNTEKGIELIVEKKIA
jgi:serine/threonine-protein kinase RsbW